MEATARTQAPRVQIRVRGPVPAGSLERLGLEVRQAPRHTVLRGAVADRSQLLGVLERLRLDGLEIVDVRPLPPARPRE